MGTRQAQAARSRLEGVRRRFERWRRTRRGLSRIPESLWAAAVKAAGAAGISHTAKTLGVNHQALKKRIAEAAATSGGSGQVAADRHLASVPTFLELAAPTRTDSCRCTLELKDASGAKIRVHLQSAEAPDLAAISRSFWELRS
jgi:hypothetical protein